MKKTEGEALPIFVAVIGVASYLNASNIGETPMTGATAKWAPAGRLLGACSMKLYRW